MREEAGERRYPVQEEQTLLPFLLAHVKGKSRNAVKSLLSRRQVLLNGKPVSRFDTPLSPGDTVTLLPPGRSAPPFPILFEDEALIAIDKPHGLLTAATENETERTAYRLLHDYLGGTAEEKKLFLVHRLDKDTSGVVLFAKNAPIKYALQQSWGELVQKRAYLAIVEGCPDPPQGTVRSWLHESRSHMVYSGPPGGGSKEAVTRYSLLESRKDLSLLYVELDTGRKNQIRVHMKDLGCPVAGDVKYGRRCAALGRLGLHACALELLHPQTGQLLALHAAAPREFRKLFPRQF